MNNRHKKQLCKIVLIALAYFLMARLGLLLALKPGFATAFWPPSGIAVTAVLLFGCPIWPGIFLGSLLANLLTPIGSISTSFIVSMGIAIGSTLQSLALGYMLRTWTNSLPYLFQTRRNMVSLLVFTLFCCFISPTISLTTLWGAGIVSSQTFGINWLTWWLGDIGGIYIFTPFLFAWSRPFNLAALTKRGFEALCLLTSTTAISLLCFGGFLSHGYPLEYLLMPCLIWSVFRFSSPITTSLVVLISVTAVVGTTLGFGPFAQLTLNVSLLLLQTFLAVMAATTLILISVVNEVWHAQEVMESYSKELKNRMKNQSAQVQMKTDQLQKNLKRIEDENSVLQQFLERALKSKSSTIK